MRRRALRACLVIAAVLAGCQGTSYRPARVSMHNEEPEWISRGAGEFHTEHGKRLMAVGRAWENPDFDVRRRVALRKARSELEIQLDAYVDSLVHRLAKRFDKNFGANRKESRRFFKEIGHQVVDARVHAVEASREWESLIRHEVYVLVELPTALVLDDFRKAVLAGMAAGGRELFRGGTRRAMQKLEQELNKAVVRSPLGDLSA
jgi:hypothetical protein